jgi:hypothetical protein
MTAERMGMQRLRSEIMKPAASSFRRRRRVRSVRDEDRRIFDLNAEQWTKFQEAVEAPPRELPALKKLLTEPAYFDLDTDKQEYSDHQ